MAGIDIISDSTGKKIVAAIQSTDVAQARILEINTAAEAKKNEVLESIPEDYSNISKEVDELKDDLSNLDSYVNILDQTKITNGYFVWGFSSGKPVENENSFYSDFIPIDPSKTYTYGFIGNDIDRNSIYICCYDKKDYNNFTGSWKYEITDKYLNFESNTKYVIISGPKSSINNIIFRKNKTIFECFDEKENVSDFLKLSNYIDLIDRDYVTDGHIVWEGSSGRPDTNPSYSYSDFIKVNGNETFTCHNTTFVNAYSSNDFDSYINTTTFESDGTYTTPSNAKYIVISANPNDFKELYFRRNKTIYEEIDSIKDNVIEIGVGKKYATLRSGIAEAMKKYNSNVIVYPGVYDLAEEFASEIADGSALGIPIGHGINITFMAGSYVKAILDNTRPWTQFNFSPFYSFEGSYSLNGLNCEAQNTRYCVHDDTSTQPGIFTHEYKNCIMKYTNTFENGSFVACIGGGMSSHSYIIVEGGVYECYNNLGDNFDTPITWHNGLGSDADGKIFINNVYLKNKGHFRFGMYGYSTIKTPVIVSNCSMGMPIDLMYETEDFHNENFELITWNNEIRS